MSNTRIHAVTCKVTFFQHFLSYKSLISKMIFTFKIISGKSRNTPLFNFQTIFISQSLPTFFVAITNSGNNFPRFNTLHNFQCGQRCCRSNTLSPKCTTNPCFLCSIHNLPTTNYSTDSISVPNSLTIYSHIRFYSIFLI